MSRSVAPVAAALLGILAAAPPGRAETIQIEVMRLAYSPAQVTAHVGDTIEWVNNDFIAHTATGRNHQFDVTMQPHKSAKAVLSKPGKIEYYCRFHPNMKGEVTVE
jgi:plastocyanin